MPEFTQEEPFPLEAVHAALEATQVFFALETEEAQRQAILARANATRALKLPKNLVYRYQAVGDESFSFPPGAAKKLTQYAVPAGRVAIADAIRIPNLLTDTSKHEPNWHLMVLEPGLKPADGNFRQPTGSRLTVALRPETLAQAVETRRLYITPRTSVQDMDRLIIHPDDFLIQK
jgi:hypothetical protein